MPRQDIQHTLDVVRGYNGLEKLTFQAPVDSAVQFPLYAGSVVHLNANGKFEAGVKAATMPLFLWHSVDDFDVVNDGTNTTAAGDYDWFSVFPGQTQADTTLTAYVATGGFELVSTEFDTSATYAPNDLLTSSPNNTNAARGGKLRKLEGAEALYTTPVVGVVSRGTDLSKERIARLYFWPVFLPGTSDPAA